MWNTTSVGVRFASFRVAELSKMNNVGNAFFVIVTPSLNVVKDNIGNRFILNYLENNQQHFLAIIPILNGVKNPWVLR